MKKISILGIAYNFVCVDKYDNVVKKIHNLSLDGALNYVERYIDEIKYNNLKNVKYLSIQKYEETMPGNIIDIKKETFYYIPYEEMEDIVIVERGA